MDPSALGLALLLGATAASGWYQAAATAHRQGEEVRTIALCDQGLARQTDWRLLRLRAEAYQYLGRYDRAEADLLAGLQAAPDQAELLEGMGWLRLFQQRPAEAETWLRQALQQDADSFWIQLNLAHALLLQHRQQAAATVYCRLSRRPEGHQLARLLEHDFARLRQAGVALPAPGQARPDCALSE